ncbi:hypothetical protein FPSE_02545 [Fusarium pseudograminearum CS3096]|uniref:Uncharacterized protein n=1 Tax=Fusarium pseudograminearum (strain CS3096) TaxID=1028729 RepID=K3W297_FUSPC|nr:hypothetical protein FPSE_02545 [Fusarium pseudograminearum CS3096]EKJ77270.1 hypothetical protein FPSE_02545 [Fusarium pseudograminearum CS3096]KAF0636434.1 hypothetical protein FPSE5266_02545 [Fusarium pseudograminearum]
MPNHVILASGAVVAVSVAVATAVAIFESPEVRRYADDVRRRIAIALHSMGEGIDPPYREPRFNRPEDADGFLQTRGGAEAGVDADEETRRRQREELLYWNSVMLEKQEKDQKERGETSPSVADSQRRGSSFDDFLRQDDGAEQGTYVFNTGADTRGMDEGLRRRGDGPRGFTPLYTNPFADEHHIDHDEINDEPEQTRQIAPAADEVSDIYSATTQDKDEKPTPAVLIDADPTPARSESASTATLEREIGVDEYMTAGQENRDEAYASIQAWAQNTSTDFYSPLPVTPTAPMSEPEIISDDGMLTPTDSVSLVGSGEDIANDAQSSRADENGRYYDVMSESSGMATPASWSEIGSVISESDAPVPVRR